MSNVSHAFVKITGDKRGIESMIKSLEHNHGMFIDEIDDIEFIEQDNKYSVCVIGEFRYNTLGNLYLDKSGKNGYSFDTEVEHYGVHILISAIESINNIAEAYECDCGNVITMIYRGEDCKEMADENRANPEYCKITDVSDMPIRVWNHGKDKDKGLFKRYNSIDDIINGVYTFES